MTARRYRPLAALVLVAALGACSETDPTVVLVTVDKRPGVWPIDTLTVAVENAGQTKNHDFSLDGQTFPVTFTVSANGREGRVNLTLSATDSDGALRAAGAASVDLLIDDTVETSAMLAPTDFVVNSSIAGAQRLTFTAEESGRQLAVSPNGGFMVVFEDDCGPLFRCDMFARLFDASGQPAVNDTAQTDDAFIANLASDKILVAPSVAAGTDGYMMIWEGDSGIDAVVLSNTGSHLLSAEVDVSDASDGLPYSAHVAALGNGTFIVVWIELDTMNGGNIVMGRILDKNGVPVVNAVSADAGPFQISTSASNTVSGPVVASTGPAAGFVVAWRGDTSIRARFFDSGGSPVTGTEVSLVTYPAGASLLSPHLVWSGDSAIVSWGVKDPSAGSFNDGALLAAGFTGPSGTQSTPLLVVEREVPGIDDFSASAPSIVAHGEGLAMAWHSCAPNRSDGDGCAVRHQLIRPSLLPLGDPVVSATTTTGDQTAPSIGSLGTSLAIAWTDESEQEPDTSSLAVRARLVYPLGEPVDGRRGARCGRPGDAPCADNLVCLAGAEGTPSCHDACDTQSAEPQCPGGGLCTRQGEVDGCLF